MQAHTQDVATFQSQLSAQSQRALQAEAWAITLDGQLVEEHAKVATIVRAKDALQVCLEGFAVVMIVH